MINEIFEKVVKGLLKAYPVTKLELAMVFSEAYKNRGIYMFDDKPEKLKTDIRSDALKAMTEVLDESGIDKWPDYESIITHNAPELKIKESEIDELLEAIGNMDTQ